MKVKKIQPTLSLQPTQFALGVLEVESKVVELKSLKRRKLEMLIRDTPVPVVISPWKKLCIVDHHHFVFACWHADVAHVRVTVVKDYSRSKLTYRRFWRRMARENQAYLYDQFGGGPRDPLYLPTDVRGMADDPYRSLAWMVRKEGGYDNSVETFAEFRWADFFRKYRLLEGQGRAGLRDAIPKGVRLAHSSKASSLPGYSPDRRRLNKPPTGARVPPAKKKGPLATKPAVQ